MRRQIMRIAITVVLLMGAAVAAHAQDQPASVYVDGKLQTYRPPARVRAGVTYVPLRQGAQSLGLECKWLEKQGRAQICAKSGCALIRKSEGIIVEGSLFLPLRRMGEVCGARVQWDAVGKAVLIEKPRGDGS
jgi:hypothetical protein